MIKGALFTIPLIGFILGYLGMHAYNRGNLNKTQVLSVTAPESPTDTPTPEPTATPLPTEEPTVIPTPTNTPTPTPTRIIQVPIDLKPLFDEFSKIYGIDEQKLIKIADCESHFNRGIYAEPYAGMYQFSESTWTKYRVMMGKDPNINLRFGARESIETAAFVIFVKQEYIWPACSRL